MVSGRVGRLRDHENHERRIMISRFCGCAAARSMARGINPTGVSRMKWETPQAVEMRFGMEITMYVYNR
jgi:coenzyme PQQ precursor peptide PqqA